MKHYGTYPVARSKDLNDSPNLADALPTADRLYLEGNHERMQDRSQQLDAPAVKAYVDDVLRRDRITYVKFVREFQ